MMARKLILVSFIVGNLLLPVFTGLVFAECTPSPPTDGWDAGYSAYARWCRDCGGTPYNDHGVGCDMSGGGSTRGTSHREEREYRPSKPFTLNDKLIIGATLGTGLGGFAAWLSTATYNSSTGTTSSGSEVAIATGAALGLSLGIILPLATHKEKFIPHQKDYELAAQFYNTVPLLAYSQTLSGGSIYSVMLAISIDQQYRMPVVLERKEPHSGCASILFFTYAW